LNHNYRYSGTYYRAMPMAEQLARRGHQVTLLTVSRTQPWQPTWTMMNGIRLCETPGLAWGSTGEGYGPFDNAYRILHAARHSYDVIHMFDHKPNATWPGPAGRARGARLVADWADWWGGPGGVNDTVHRRVPAIARFEAWWEIRSKLLADGVVTISRVLERRALAVGCRRERLLYLPTGAPTERIVPMPREEARRRLNLPPDRRIVGFIGMGQGDLAMVMQALQQLPGVWLMVIGEHNPQVLDLAGSLGVADRLWQAGFIPDDQVGIYLACADVMCLPMEDRAANRGRLPNKLLDYLAAGRPVVASPVGDVKEIMETQRVGVLTDPATFAEALQTLLADAALCRELGFAARRVAETTFGWGLLIDQLEVFYARIVATA
jgi:glycosyltransferase involved in cell wall biosynthesis